MGSRRILIGVLVICSVSWIGAPSGGAAPPDFVMGEATASADSVGLRLLLGNASVGYAVGRSVARYQESLASADGRALDLEAMPILFGEIAACEGVVPMLPKAALPPVTSIDSTQPNSTESRRVEAFYPQIKVGPSFQSAGFQDAKADKTPASWAATETPTTDLGIYAIYGGRTEVRTELVGQVRKATASFKADAISFLGGMATIINPRWEATATSGAEEKVQGTFDFDAGTLFGLFRTREQAHGDVRWIAEGVANLFSLLGARLELPEVKIDGGTVKVTPMTFKLVDLPLGRLGINPLVTFFRDQIDDYYNQLRAQGCEGKSNAQLYQLLEGIVTGNGSVELPIGGVAASTDDTYYPPIEAPPPPPPDDTVAPAPPAVEEIPAVEGTNNFVAPTPGYSSPSYSDSPLGFVDEAPLDVPVEEIAAPVEEEASDEIEFAAPASASERRFENGAAGGVAAILGGIALAGGLGLAVADRMSMLRPRRRVIPS